MPHDKRVPAAHAAPQRNPDDNPFLLNCWYVAAGAEELSERPFSRRLLNEPVALFRTQAGEPVALFDRCPHRFVPLSMGKVVGDLVECPYHGLRFDRGGACVHNPNGKGYVPAQARVRSYPLVERNGWIWIWPGDPSAADANAIPDMSFLTSSARMTVTGYLHVRANYMLVVDNLLDASHAQTLHPAFARPGGQATESRVLQEGGLIKVLRSQDAAPVSRLYRMLWEENDEIGDTHSDWTWIPPSLVTHSLGVTRVGSQRCEGLVLLNAHLITPETRYTCHYFWAASRNQKRDDPELDSRLASMIGGIFRDEDTPIIEAQQQALGEVVDIASQRPVLLSADAAAIRARRAIAARIAAEHAASGERERTK